MRIVDVKAREIIDSRGNPTIEVDIVLDSGIIGRAAVPSGASTGKREALELRDFESKDRYNGKGVKTAVNNVNSIIKNELLGINVYNQSNIDNRMLLLDGSENKSNLGANAILGVSMAVARAAANAYNIPLYRYIGGIRSRSLPMPMMNVINGGVHAANNLDIQEFMIIPKSATSVSEAIRMGSEVFHNLKSLLNKRNLSTSVGDEGGFAPNLSSNEEAILLILEAIKMAKYKEGKDIVLALDVAASSFFKNGKYFLKSEDKILEFDQLVEYYCYLVKKYPIVSIEDGLVEDDWDGWAYMTKKLEKIQVVGDDIFVTNPKLLLKGINKLVANSILIKLNQIGTLTETLRTIRIAKLAGYSTIISHRSGETEDTFISDLSVAVNSLQIKTGSLSRSDRTSKYNQLIRLEEELGSESLFYKNI